MKNTKKIVYILLAIFICTPFLVFAHQPRINTSTETIVPDPEISKAYYGQLAGEPHIYDINSPVPFILYVNTLVPDIAGQKTDVVAKVFSVNSKGSEIIATLDGTHFIWKKFFEPFGHDNYLMGPEYKTQVTAGEYKIEVSSLQNDSKYSLAIGETEAFDLKESINAINLIPKIKKSFFNENPINFILSPFGWGYILAIYLLAFIVGLIDRLIFKMINRNKINKIGKNINKKGRLIRAVLGIALLLIAITTTWNPIVLFLSGYCLFEAIFGWCVIYQLIG